MTDERPEDEQRREEADAATPADTQPAAEPPAALEPAEPAAQEPAEPVAPEPAEPAAQEPAEPAGRAAQEPAEPAAAEASAPEPPAGSGELEELEDAPRQKPEIPGADLIPDIVTESQEFLDAEAQAAAEAEAEAAAAREREQVDDEPQPIADAAIDLAAGARYTATGKRKTAVARVTLRPGTGTYSINGRSLEAFFPRATLGRVIRQPLETVGYEARMDVVARMHGGGIAAQAGALRHGISRALIEADPKLRGELKRRGFLTRDPRVKERKKAGLKKARKRPQFSKR
ncbi:MAG: 30S ribosomal protein S9 [Solirubrobacteraceae bacterium]